MTSQKPGPGNISGKIIDITQRLKAKNPTVNQRGMDLLNEMSRDDADIVIGFVLNMILANIEIGLGTIDTDDDPELEKFIEEMTDDDMIFFEKVNAIYNKAYRNCYFCRNDIDPNADPITKQTHICLTCRRKLGNFMEYLGVPRDKVFKLQKS